MKRLLCTLLTAVLLPFCTGCAQNLQLENQAYTLILGADIVKNEISITAQVLKASASGDANSSAENGSPYMIASSRGETYAAALQSLQLAVQRRLNLTQTILIVVSEELARSNSFLPLISHMYETYAIDTSAWFAVCQGSAQEFVAAQKPVIGNRVSIATTAMLENYVKLGSVPNAIFADVYHASVSAFSDPVAIYAAKAQKQNDISEKAAGTPAFSNAGGAEEPGNVLAQSEAETVFLGTALFHNGKMTGTLTPEQTLCLNLIHGGLKDFTPTVNGHTVRLASVGKPSVRVDIEDDVPKIQTHITLNMEANADFPSPEEVASQLEKAMQQLTAHCMALGTEPFGFAGYAAYNFATLEQWQNYGWHNRFPMAQCSYTVSVKTTDT